jgi:hypothetical protein
MSEPFESITTYNTVEASLMASQWIQGRRRTSQISKAVSFTNISLSNIRVLESANRPKTSDGTEVPQQLFISTFSKYPQTRLHIILPCASPRIFNLNSHCITLLTCHHVRSWDSCMILKGNQKKVGRVHADVRQQY